MEETDHGEKSSLNERLAKKAGFTNGSAFCFGKCELHTLIHTFAFETKPQYLGLSLENAEFLAPLFLLLIRQYLTWKYCI